MKLFLGLFFLLIGGQTSTVLAGGNIGILFMPNQQDYQLKYTTAAQTVSVGNCSGVLTVQTYDPNGTAITVSSSLTVNFSSGAGVTFYSDQECLTGVTSATIASGSGSTKVYFAATATGSYTVTGTATGYTDATQTETITTNGYVWTGGGADANWSTAANWSGGAVPGATTAVIFDGTCVSNCSPNLSANTSVGPVRINSGYTGTITQGAYTLTVGGSWVQQAGNFVGSSTGIGISIKGGILLLGGNFKSTNGTLSLPSTTLSITFRTDNPAYFTHNSGTIYVNPTPIKTPVIFTAPLGVSYYNFTFHLNQGAVTLNNTVTIANTMTIDDTFLGTYNGGTFNISGNLLMTGTRIEGSTLFKMVGVSPTINASGALSGVTCLEIAASGTVSLVGTINISTDFTYTSGTVDPGTSTLSFYNSVNTLHTTLTPGTVVYNNVTFAPNNNVVTVVGTFSIGGTLAIQYSCCGTMNGGTLDARGNVSISTGNISGTTVLQMNGTTSATLSQSTTGPSSIWVVNKTGGAGVTLSTNVTLTATSQTITLTSGSIDMAGHNLSLKAAPSLNGNTITKNGGVLTVNGVTIGTGSMYGGTVSP